MIESIQSPILASTDKFSAVFRERVDEEHRRLAEEYRALPNPAQRAAFVKEFATRWSELIRLPYFDLTRMIVVDPMHNLILGRFDFVSRAKTDTDVTVPF